MGRGVNFAFLLSIKYAKVMYATIRRVIPKLVKWHLYLNIFHPVCHSNEVNHILIYQKRDKPWLT